MRNDTLARTDSGHIMQIQNFSVNDGDGIRTNIFLCGCPLSCVWCCNPEHAAYFDDEHIMSVSDVDEVVSRMAPFFRFGGGGITFSGGECTMQEGFLRSLAEHFYDKGYSLTMETCGYFDFDSVKDILSKMDLIFYDLKLMDPAKHEEFTGLGNELILANLPKICQMGIPLVVRIPVIEGVNADEQNIRNTYEFISKEAPAARLELLPYHELGFDKYRQLGQPTPAEICPQMKTPSDELLTKLIELAKEYDIKTVSFK